MLPEGNPILTERETGSPSIPKRLASQTLLKIENAVTIPYEPYGDPAIEFDYLHGFDVTDVDGVWYRYIIPGSLRSTD